MIFSYRLTVILFILFLKLFPAQDTIKVTYYNLLNFPVQEPDRIDTLKKVLDFIKPDVLVVNELTSFNGGVMIKNHALNADTNNTYASAVFYDGPDTDNLLFYNQSKFGIFSQKQITTTLRDISEYVLYYKSPHLSISNDTTLIYIYSLHLKAGNSPTSSERRNQDAVIFKQYLINNGMEKKLFVGGDFNFYDYSELGCQEILYGQNLTLTDPINRMGNWHNNSSYSNYHTQSTRLNSGSYAGGASGGMDDRFDFIFVSDDIVSGSEGVKYLDSSYQIEGQDGSCFNQALNFTTNSVIDQELATAFYYMSDHLPVSMQFCVGGTVGEKTMRSSKIDILYDSEIRSISIKSERSPVLFNMYDINGRCILKKSVSRNKFNVDLSMIKNGFYIVSINTKNESLNKKILVK
jgi:hypothetical protein